MKSSADTGSGEELLGAVLVESGNVNDILEELLEVAICVHDISDVTAVVLVVIALLEVQKFGLSCAK